MLRKFTTLFVFREAEFFFCTGTVIKYACFAYVLAVRQAKNCLLKYKGVLLWKIT